MATHRVTLPTGRIAQRESPRVYKYAIVIDDRADHARDLVETEAALSTLGDVTEEDRAELVRLRSEMKAHEDESTALHDQYRDAANASSKATNYAKSFHYFLDRSPHGAHHRDPVTGWQARYDAVANCRARRFEVLTVRLKGLREQDGCGVFGWSQSPANAEEMAAAARKFRSHGTVTVVAVD